MLEKRYLSRFTAMETAIAGLKSTGNYLTNLVAQWNKDGKMPNLTIMLLPSDHTAGTRPGSSTPKSMVADNDLAVGQIVEGLTKSKFWPKMAILCRGCVVRIHTIC